MTKRWVLLTVAAAMLVASGVMLWMGRPQEPPPLPVPSAEIDVPSAQPKGPTSADIDGDAMDPSKMESNTIFIPAIGAYSPIDPHGLDSTNTLVLPTDANTMSHFHKSADLDAAEGNTLLAGHVTYNQYNGSLYNLASATAGDRAYLKGDNGEVQEFVLVSLKSYIKKDLPIDVWVVDGDRRLTVVTCGGPVVHTPHGRIYRDNLVSVFVPVSP